MSSTPRDGLDPPSELPESGSWTELAEPGPTPLCLFGLGISLDTASIDALEEVSRSVTRAMVADWFSRLGGTQEVALLSTCHRVELVVVTRFPEEVDRWRSLLPGDRETWRVRSGRDVVAHVFRVAAGQGSLARGEAEVRHQVRAAASSVVSRHPRTILRPLFLDAARAADEIAPPSTALPSIAAIATARLVQLVPSARPRVVVVGAGTVGRQVVQQLVPSARVTVVYHQRPPDPTFVRDTGASAVGLDRMREAIATSDAVVTAAKFGNRGLHASDLPRDRPLVLIDLGLPRNIDPDVRSLPNVRLVDLAELHELTDSRAPTNTRDERLESIADRYAERVERLLLEPWVEALRHAVEEVRRSELANARPFLGALDADQEHAVDLLTRRLVSRLLHSPTERIRSIPAGPEGDVRRQWALDLLRPDSPDP